MCWVRFPCALGWAHVEHCMSHVSMFLGTRKSVSTLYFPFGSPMLPFEVREVVCLLEMSPFVPHLDSMSNGYIRAFGPCVPSFTMYAHVCSPPCGLKLQCFPVHGWVVLQCAYVLYLLYLFMWMDTDFSSGKSPFLGFQWECSVLEEAPKACVSLSGRVLAWVVREFWIGFPRSVELTQEGFT